MKTTTLPFGTAGLDRYTGEMAVRPGSLRDARNVRVRGSKLEVRKGMSTAITLPDQGGHPCTHVVLLEPLKFEAAAVAVGYYAASRELWLYRLPADASSATSIGGGAMFTLDAAAVSPPRLHGAEMGGRFLIAHDEPLQSKRAATFVYDPLGATQLFQLTAALDSAGEAPVRHRVVLPWQEYIVGVGFASATENRPEVVRVCIPGRPLQWDPNHFFIAGTRGSPVVSIRPAGGHLMVMKPSSTHRIHGSSHLDFGILPLHALTGALNHALTIEIDGRCYTWSAEGPMVLTGAIEPGELETPLDLEGPQPEGFEGLDFETGYVQYLHGLRQIEWVFGAKSFVFDLRTRQWVYGESAVQRYTGSLLYTGTSLADELDNAPTGFPANVAAAPGATTADVAWDNNGADGNETAEVWIEPEGEDWYMAEQVAVAGASQSVTVEGLVVAVDYRTSVRFRRGGRYTSGYESNDPSSWPATSQDSFTTLLDPPTLDSVVWSRTGADSEQALVSFTPADSSVKHRVLRDGVVVTTLNAGVTSYADTGITGEVNHTHTVVAVSGVYESDPSNSIETWMGPFPEPSAASYATGSNSCTGGGDPKTVTWTDGQSASVEVWGDDGLLKTVAAATETAEVCVVDPPTLKVRHVVTTSGTDDHSPFEPVLPEQL